MSAAKFHKFWLVRLANATVRQLKNILTTLTTKQKKALKEIALMLLNRRLPVAKKAVQKLKKYKPFLRQLADTGLKEVCRHSTSVCRLLKYILRTAQDLIKSL